MRARVVVENQHVHMVGEVLNLLRPDGAGEESGAFAAQFAADEGRRVEVEVEGQTWTLHEVGYAWQGQPRRRLYELRREGTCPGHPWRGPHGCQFRASLSDPRVGSLADVRCPSCDRITVAAERNPLWSGPPC